MTAARSQLIIDNLGLENVIGSIAGDNTIFLAQTCRRSGKGCFGDRNLIK